MPHSRRSFLTTAVVGGAAFVPFLQARGLEARVAGRHDEDDHRRRGSEPSPIRLDSNENPYGPASDAMDAVMRAFGEAHRYPDSTEEALRAAIAAHHGVKAESVILGCGSTELLMMVTDAFASPTRRVVTAAPSFETPVDVAKRKGAPLVSVPVARPSLQLDLDAMLAQSSGAGLVYLCNPNNPTGTIVGHSEVAALIATLGARSPETHVVVDEAYFEYADDPTFRTAIPLALANPRVIVTRTFSKIHGMAGLRAGYAIAAPETIARLEPYRVPSGINALVGAAAKSSLEREDHVERQVTLNREARTWAMQAMTSLGFSVVPSQTNFFLTDIRRDPKAFKATCREKGVWVGRHFPGLETHARISIGTMDEMRAAMNVIADVLKKG